MLDDSADQIRFSEEEAAFLRHVRFGQLPPRVVPAEWVETLETEQPWLPGEGPYEPGASSWHLR